jgi:hypothetical protein
VIKNLILVLFVVLFLDGFTVLSQTKVMGKDKDFDYQQSGGDEVLTYKGKPFTGIRVDEDESKGAKKWEAHTNYKDGIPDGEVIVWSEGKELYRFRYEKGKKILPETIGTK